MNVSKVAFSPSFGHTQNQKPGINYVKITGYGALASGVLCGFTAKKRKYHKMFAYIAGALSLAHIGILEYYKHKRK